MPTPYDVIMSRGASNPYDVILGIPTGGISAVMAAQSYIYADATIRTPISISAVLAGQAFLRVDSNIIPAPPLPGGGWAGYIPYPDRKESKRSESRIVNASYNAGSHQLIVTTNIVFNGVPKRKYEEMKASRDKAKYFKAHIKGRYQEDPID